MNLLAAQRALLNLTIAGNSAFLTSPSGFGKSSIIEQNYETLKGLDPKVRWGSCTLFLATQRPTSLIGVQWKGERQAPTGRFGEDGKIETRTVTVTDPAVPLWMIDTATGLPAWCFDKFYLFLDEYGQADPDTKRAAAEIFLKGGVAPWYLPAGSVVVAASNKGSRYGVTKDFDFIVARRTEIEISGDVDVTLAHWDKPYMWRGSRWEVSPWMKAWAKANPTILFEGEPKQQGPWCHPRSALDVDRYVQVCAAQNGGTAPAGNNPAAAEMAEVMQGMVGVPATQSMSNFLTFRLELPQYEDVVVDPMGTKAPKRADLMLLMAYELAARCQPDHLAEVITYVSNKLPKDMAITFITALLRRDYSFVNTPPVQGWIAKNAQLVSVISAIAGQK